VFVPSNEAFSSLPNSVVRDITGDDDRLRSVVRHHLVSGGKIFSAVIRDDALVDTAANEEKEKGLALRFNVAEAGDLGKVVMVGGAELDLDRVDLRASNGVVHFLKEVIYPIPDGTIFEVANVLC